MLALEVVALVSLSAWILLTVDRSRRWADDLYLPESPAGSGGGGASVVAIVPARNEAALLPVTLPALLEQSGVSLRVILVDDGSTDGSAEVALRVAETVGGLDRLEIIRADARPPGWSGKVHALLRGYQAAGSPEWLLLTDADILHRPGSVTSLLSQAGGGESTRSFDLISVMARLHAKTFWERLTIPAFVFFFQLLYPFRRIPRQGSSVAAAAGGCVLIRRDLLEAVGGFAAIHDAVIDDVALAKQAKRVGGRLWLGFDSGIVSLRVYQRLRDVWQMVARTAFTQLGHSWILLIVTLMALSIVVVSPPAVIGAGIIDLMVGAEADPRSATRAIVWALAAWLLMSRSLLPVVRHHGMRGRWAATLPVSGALYALMTVGSAWQHLRGEGPSWRGRRISGTSIPDSAMRHRDKR